MRIVTLPSLSSLQWALWLLTGALFVAASLTPGSAIRALLLSCALGLCLLAGLLMRRRMERLKADNAQLKATVRVMEAAEDLGGYGRWCIECEPRHHVWSAEMCSLMGLPHLAAPDEDLLHRIIPRGYEQIELVLHAHEADTDDYTLEFEVTPEGRPDRMLRARVKNMFGPDGVRERVFMVVHDVTAAYALRRDRDEALVKAAEARQEADTDVLTGLANRRCIMNKLDRAVMDARCADEPLSIIVLDIDCFKRVNDQHGHLIGDRVIRTVAEIAARQGRGPDTVGRIGGEEFMWIMPDCNGTAALLAAERLRWAVEAGTHSAPIPSVTISAGHAVLQQGEAPLMLFARADDALYEAKRSGRNRIVRAA